MIFDYPPSLPAKDYAGFAYMSSRVKLEFGARGDPWPTEKREIVSYAAQEFPDFFEAPACSVDVLALRRTFWEKATCATTPITLTATSNPRRRHTSPGTTMTSRRWPWTPTTAGKSAAMKDAELR